MKNLKSTKRSDSKKEIDSISLVLYLLLYGMLMFGLMGCSTETRDWRAAQSSNNIEALEEYIQQYPDGKFFDEAHTLIEDLIFAGTEEQDDIAGYEKYLTLYPEGRFRQDADERIEARHFADAQEQNNVAAYEGYLSLYPEGRFRQDADERIEALHFADAQEQDNVTAYEEYLSLYPEGRFRRDAEERTKALSTQTPIDLDERVLGNVKLVLVNENTGQIIQNVKNNRDLILSRINDPEESKAYIAKVQEYMDKVELDIDDEGGLHFKGVPPGTYVLTLWISGSILEIIVSPGETVDLGIIEVQK